MESGERRARVFQEGSAEMSQAEAALSAASKYIMGRILRMAVDPNAENVAGLCLCVCLMTLRGRQVGRSIVRRSEHMHFPGVPKHVKPRPMRTNYQGVDVVRFCRDAEIGEIR